MDMSAMEHADHGKQTSAEHCPPAPGHHVLWEKCGYCSLLFNCPALTGGVSFASVCHSARQHLHHALATPGPCPADLLPRRPHPRPASSSRKHSLLISHGPQDSQSPLTQGELQAAGRVVYDCSMEIVMSRFSAVPLLEPCSSLHCPKRIQHSFQARHRAFVQCLAGAFRAGR